jgi:hypothetical protein
LLFMRRFGTQMNCPAASGLAQVRKPKQLLENANEPPITGLGGEYPIRRY